MKTGKLIQSVTLAATALLALSTIPARAGEKVGNGGGAVVCRTASGAITSAELLDLFEGVNQMGLGYPDRNTGVDLEIDIAKTRMVSNPNFLSKFADELATVKSNLVFLPRGIGLEPTNDAFPLINKRDLFRLGLLSFRPKQIFVRLTFCVGMCPRAAAAEIRNTAQKTLV